MQSSAVITRSNYQNITQVTASTTAEIKLNFELTAYTGELWGIYYQDFEECRESKIVS